MLVKLCNVLVTQDSVKTNKVIIKLKQLYRLVELFFVYITKILFKVNKINIKKLFHKTIAFLIYGGII